MKTLVTGGSGFIGSHIVDRLIKDGHEVTVIDNLSTGKFKNLEKSIADIIFINGDIRDLDLLMDKFKGIDVVFHTAAKARVQPSFTDPLFYSDNNIGGTLNVLWAAKENKVKRVVYSASSSAYGDQDKMPLKETMIPNPKSPYALTKYVGELNMKLWADYYGVETVSLRYFNVYGKRQTDLIDGAYATVIGVFLGQVTQKKPITIVGDGFQRRDFTYIDDITEANIKAGMSQNVGKGEVINIGYGKNYSILEVADLIGGKDYPKKFLPARKEPKNTQADNTLCQKLLSFKPEISLKEGLKCISQK